MLSIKPVQRNLAKFSGLDGQFFLLMNIEVNVVKNFFFPCLPQTKMPRLKP